jgi:hypothetical protein
MTAGAGGSGTPGSAARILISYRRKDAAASAGRLYDRLSAHYGPDAVFMDIDNITVGSDFRQKLDEVLRGTDMVLAVIGTKWSREARRRRLTDETDYVRLELETALQRGIPVIPVLVDGAAMPKASDLPASLGDLAFRQAAEIDTGRDFHSNVDRLLRDMDGILGPRPSGPAPARGARLPEHLLGARIGDATRPAPTSPRPEFVFYKEKSWWLLSALLVVGCTGGALLARWLVDYGATALNLPVAGDGIAWWAVALAGLIWSLLYATGGGSQADSVSDTLFPMLEPLLDIFHPTGFSDVVRGLLTAFPLNILLAIAISLGLGALAVARLAADFSAVAHLAFLLVTIFQMAWWFVHADPF